jgi:site-specific DNA-methyltransferase (adenine-specific)
MPYYPQGLQKINKVCKNHKHDHQKAGGISQRPSHKDEYVQEWTNYPISILQFDCENNTIHPTQKPYKLMEYLIKTYTLEGETVLDFTMGSGTTGVAAIRTNRKFVGIELDKDYFDVARQRIEKINNVNNFITI